MGMKKVIGIIVGILAILLLGLLGETSGFSKFSEISDFRNADKIPTGAVVQSVVSDEGAVSVHFCPDEDCEQLLLDFLDSGEQVDCAFYELRLEKVISLLDKKHARVVVDVDTHTVPLDVVEDAGYGLMHQKFCVVDGERVVTGSMNPTVRGATQNNNNLIFIESEQVAAHYAAEFEELFAQGKNVDSFVHDFDISGVEMSIYFCPEDECADKIVRELRKAEENIYFMTFSFTHAGILNALLLRYDDGVEVRGVMEARMVGGYSVFDTLQFQGVDVVKDGNKATMHHKTFVVDNLCVITGSMNPTKGGDERNDENLLIICDEEIAAQYEAEFWKVYGEAHSVILET
jgi:phosphatidylserine/phosphatidylglycerophosphate/cardiolipin synthase-like enzyme